MTGKGLRIRPLGEGAKKLVETRPEALRGAQFAEGGNIRPRIADLARANIEEGATDEFFLMSAEDILALIDDSEGVAAYERTRGEEKVPAAVVDRLIAGENPVTVWREHRGMSGRELSRRSGVGNGYLSQIENGARDGTVATMRKLAVALAVDLDDLT